MQNIKLLFNRTIIIFVSIIILFLFQSLILGQIINSKVSISNKTYKNYNDSDGIFSITKTGDLILNNVIFTNNNFNFYAIKNDGKLTINSGRFISNDGTLIEADNSTTTIKSNTIFSSNTAHFSGGVLSIDDSSMLIDSDVHFISNTAGTSGGAIYIHESTSTINSNVIFSSNTAGLCGGAISIDDSSMLIDSDVHFISNSALSLDGGAIYSDDSTITIKSNVIFSSNTARDGGAIDNNDASLIIIDSEGQFLSNIADDYGGAINNSGRINIGSNAIFKFNKAKNYGGGAICNGFNGITDYYMEIDSNSQFISNTANSYGGAICNSGILTINSGARFISNIAGSYGGAIYNVRILNLIANTDNIEFTGNTANGVSSAIYNSGTINLWVSKNADIIFNDRITGGNTININSSTTTLNAVGKVILNEDMSGYTGTVNLYGGEIELQSKSEENSNINTNGFFSWKINLSSGTLNILNNAIDNISIYNLTTTSNANLKFDVDLSNNISDNFTIIEKTEGILNLTAINILGIDKDSGQITLFNNEKVPTLNILTTANYGGYEYTFTNSDIPGVLNYEKTGMIAKTFKEVINTTEPINRSYSLINDEIVIDNIGNLGGTQLTIFGNGYDINGNSKSGIIVNENQILNIDNIKEIKSFNSENHGGFIYNYGGNSVNISDNIIFSSNKVNATAFYNSSYGGALYNYESKMNIGHNVIFSSNSSISSFDDSDVYGGAVGNENYSTLTIGKNAKFKYNYVEGYFAKGGAIYNGGHSTMTILSNALFDSNSAISKRSSHGGAIKNKGVLTICDGAKFINNRVIELEQHGDGGAIYNIRELNLIASTNNIEFTGNTANGISNAIHDNNGIINLWVSQKADIIFNDRITSEDSLSILNINRSTTTLTANGKVILNEDMNGYTGQVNLYGGTIKLGEKGTLFGGNMVVDNATIDMANEIIQEYKFNTLTINNNLNLSVDVDLENEQMDTISANNNSQINGIINVKAINVLTDNNEKETTEVLFTSSTVLKDKITSISTVSSKLYKYDIVYNDGIFNFINTGKNIPEINPVIAESAIASSIGGFATQANVLGQAFSSIDTQISNRKLAKKQGVLYASESSSIFDMENKIERGLWIRPFIAQDTININNIDVDNTLTGTLAGIDLTAGENSLLSLYLGYAGSTQKYENIKVNQTGYIVGATGMFIKDSWYTGLTANINFNKAESQSDYGTDSFDMNMYSVGAKAGYNYDINNKWILEPNLTVMYGNVSNQEYETTQGAKVDSQSNSNIIVEPQVKARLNLTNGWQPYGLLGYVANMSSKGKVVADGIEFEMDKIDGYLEYGAGVHKDFIDTPWNCYLQVTGKSGEINGVAGNLGVKYKF